MFMMKSINIDHKTLLEQKKTITSAFNSMLHYILKIRQNNLEHYEMKRENVPYIHYDYITEIKNNKIII